MRKTQLIYLSCGLVFMLISGCLGTKGNAQTAATVEINNSTQTAATAEELPGLQPIDIKVNSRFWMLRPWKEGTLVTIDSEARFAEISFVGETRARIRPLVNFPRMPIDGMLFACPESDLVITKSNKRFHVANIATKKTKSFAPFLTGIHDEQIPILLDKEEGLIAFPYVGDIRDIGRGKILSFFILYNYKEDKIIGEEHGKTEDLRELCVPIDSENIITCNRGLRPLTADIYLYNWRTGERTDNNLTKKLSGLGKVGIILGPLININIKKRFLFTDIPPIKPRIYSTPVKITWEDGFEDVKVIPLDYLLPSPKDNHWLEDFFLSPDGEWATSFVGGYDGLHNESLEKRVFFHLDERYPNGISMPIFADGYYNDYWDWGSFVQHPLHGMCFAEDAIIKRNGRDQQYLRLYKMSDVQAEINRQFFEKANELSDAP